MPPTANTTMAASTPRITMTTSSSTRVNPCSPSWATLWFIRRSPVNGAAGSEEPAALPFPSPPALVGEGVARSATCALVDNLVVGAGLRERLTVDRRRATDGVLQAEVDLGRRRAEVLVGDHVGPARVE